MALRVWELKGRWLISELKSHLVKLLSALKSITAERLAVPGLGREVKKTALKVEKYVASRLVKANLDSSQPLSVATGE